MTEAESEAWGDNLRVQGFLQARERSRKARLFACACCRAVWGGLGPDRLRRAVEAAELYADGACTRKDMDRAHSMACESALRARPHTMTRPPAHLAATPEEARLRLAAGAAHPHEPFHVGQLRFLTADEALAEASLPILRDLFGDPARPASLAPACRTAVAVSLAQAAYEQRELPSGHLEPARLAVCSDALEEAGCTDAGILSHLRSAGPHVRGCWAVDLILGKG